MCDLLDFRLGIGRKDRFKGAIVVQVVAFQTCGPDALEFRVGGAGVFEALLRLFEVAFGVARVGNVVEIRVDPGKREWRRGDRERLEGEREDNFRPPATYIPAEFRPDLVSQVRSAHCFRGGV